MRLTAGRVLLVILLVPIAGYLVWDQLESRALARDIAAIAARGEPVTLEGPPTGADTVERHDAARIYAAAAERIRAMPAEQTFRLGRIDVDSTAGPPTEIDIADLERMYRPDAPALQLLDQATPLDFNGFGDVPVDLSNSPFTTLHTLAALRADLLSARGHGDAAARALVPCVRLWRTLTAFDRGFVTGRFLASLRILFRHTKPSEASLAALKAALAEVPDSDDLVGEVRGRRARYLAYLDQSTASPGRRVVLRILRPYVTRRVRQELRSYDEALAAAALPWPRKYEAGRELEAKYSESLIRSPRRGFFAALLPMRGSGMILGVNRAGVELAARRVAATAMAIERYRRAHAESLPQTLADLVPALLPAVPIDPFTGAPLVYKPSADGYTLYSVDINAKDDGGALYGIGSRTQLAPRQGAARDLGIRVEGKR